MTNSLRPVLEQLEKAGNIIMTRLLVDYHGRETDDEGQPLVPEVPNMDQWDWDPRGKTIITIQNPGRRKENGWYRGQVWESDSNNILNALAGEANASEKFDEISLADHLLSRPLEEILEELLHQSIHAAHKNTWPATIGANGYHTLGFKRRAHKWFNVNTSPSKGWNVCTPTTECKEFIKNEVIPNIDSAVFDLMRDKEFQKRGVGSNLKKWTCGCTNLRVSTWMKGKCLDCGNEFQYADKDMNEQRVIDWLAEMEAAFKASKGITTP